MKNLIFFSAIALTGVYCFSFITPSPGARKNSEPVVIILTDSARSAGIHCEKTGNVWTVSSGSAETYLDQIAVSLGKTDMYSFIGIRPEFAPDFSAGSLTGFGVTPDGKKVPVGVAFKSGATSGQTLTMYSDEEHSCTAAPCSCCEFIKREGRILGCKCGADPECQASAQDRCNHTIKTKTTGQ